MMPSFLLIGKADEPSSSLSPKQLLVAAQSGELWLASPHTVASAPCLPAQPTVSFRPQPLCSAARCLGFPIHLPRASAAHRQPPSPWPRPSLKPMERGAPEREPKPLSSGICCSALAEKPSECNYGRWRKLESRTVSWAPSGGSCLVVEQAQGS